MPGYTLPQEAVQNFLFGFAPRNLRFAGTPYLFNSSGGVNPPCGKVFACRENACTAHPRRPRFAGAEMRVRNLPLPQEAVQNFLFGLFLRQAQRHELENLVARNLADGRLVDELGVHVVGHDGGD